MLKNRSDSRLRLVYAVSDILAVIAAYLVTLFLRFRSELGERFFTFINTALGVRRTGALDDSFIEFYTASAPRIIFFLCVTLVFLYAYFDQYAGRRFLRPRATTWNIIRANLVALLFFYGYFYLRRNEFHPRSMFLTILLLNVLFAVTFRGLTNWCLQVLRSRFQWDQCPAILLGATREAEVIRDYIAAVHPHGIRIAAHLPLDPAETWPALATRIESAAGTYAPRLLICADKRLDIPQIMRILELSERLGLATKILSDKMNVLSNQARMPVGMVMDTPLVHFETAPFSPCRELATHVWSALTASFFLILSLPLMAILAVLIKLSSRGPVFFVQERIGFNRQPFLMYKFRTMHNRAEEQQAEIEEFNESGAGLFKIRRDPRVTPVGRFIRRFSLDELPQLINVLEGQMNLVGPRPLPRRDFENYYEEWHYSRHGGLPGLTCLWQVSGRSDIDFHNMCLLDVYYLRNRGPMLDFKIILRTFHVVLFAKGAY